MIIKNINAGMFISFKSLYPVINRFSCILKLKIIQSGQKTYSGCLFSGLFEISEHTGIDALEWFEPPDALK